MFFDARFSVPLFCQMKAISTGVECLRTLSKLIKREIRHFSRRSCAVTATKCTKKFGAPLNPKKERS